MYRFLYGVYVQGKLSRTPSEASSEPYDQSTAVLQFEVLSHMQTKASSLPLLLYYFPANVTKITKQ